MIIGKSIINQFILPVESPSLSINTLTVTGPCIISISQSVTITGITKSFFYNDEMVIIYATNGYTVTFAESDNLFLLDNFSSISNASATFIYKSFLSKWVQIGASAGVNGVQGLQGNDGNIGSNGGPGSQGADGSQGDYGQSPVGSQGSQGAAGPSGQMGGQGPQGYQGAEGPQGYQGASG